MNLKVVSLCGSLRQESLNRAALKIAEAAALEAGCEVEFFDLKKNVLPLYGGDLESAGLPEVVKKLKVSVASADIVLIASPEYNYSISGALKNAIDWASRGENNSLDGKVAVIFGVSPSSVGTARGQRHLRDILSCLNVSVLPQPQLTLTAHDASFVTDETVKSRIRDLVNRTIEYAQKIK